jgi:hypothetical protein
LSIDGSRDAFWGLVALLQSIKLDTLEQDGIRFRRVSYRNPSEVFYALPDQTMRAALPRLPSGTLFGSHVTNTGSEPIDAMQVLADLSVEGNLTAQAQVNWVWQVLLGEPLVPTLGLSPDEGLEERTELKAFLAQQWKAHGGDLRKLVAWIACSDAFQRSAETHTASEYAVATQQTIQHWLLQERLFATFATWDRELHDEPQPSLEVVADWLQRSPRLPQGMLAQSPTPDANNNRGEADSVLSRTQFRFITEVRHLPKKADELVDRCLKQGMSWNLARDHAFYAGNTIVPNGRERITADEIYERCGSDTRLAMRHIVCIGLGGQ